VQTFILRTFLRPLLILIAKLPLSLVQGLGAFLGILAYLGSGQYRQLFRDHYLSMCTNQRVKPRLIKAMMASGMLFSDSLWIWRNPAKAIQKTEIQHWAEVEKAVQEGKGLVMLTPHLGGFEIIPRILAKHFQATIMYRPARQEWLNTIIEGQRSYPNMHFVPATIQGVRTMVRALHQGEAVGILPDQVPSGGDGLWTPFFNRPAYTTTLAAKLASRNQSPVIMFSAKRKGLGQGWIFDAMPLAPFSEDPIKAAQELNQSLETTIMKAPEQFIWAYNRYKHPSGAELPPSN